LAKGSPSPPTPLPQAGEGNPGMAGLVLAATAFVQV